MNEIKNTVIYHSNCTDGFVAAYFFWKYFKTIGEDCKFIPSNYDNTKPDALKGENLYIVDFSFKPLVFLEIAKGFKNVVLLDHHKTAADMYGGYNQYDWSTKDTKIFMDFNEHKSGASMAFDYIVKLDENSNIFLPYLGDGFIIWMKDCVEDRDLWKFKKEQTLEWYELLNMPDYDTFEKLDTFFNDPDRGTKLYSMTARVKLREEIAQLYASKAQRIKVFEYDVPVVNCPSNFASRVGEILGVGERFSVSYVVSTNIVFVSLRSAPDGIDVQEIAKLFGGGGHIHAAGFNFKPERLIEFFNNTLPVINIPEKQDEPEIPLTNDGEKYTIIVNENNDTVLRVTSNTFLTKEFALSYFERFQLYFKLTTPEKLAEKILLLKSNNN